MDMGRLQAAAYSAVFFIIAILWLAISCYCVFINLGE